MEKIVLIIKRKNPLRATLMHIKTQMLFNEILFKA